MSIPKAEQLLSIIRTLYLDNNHQEMVKRIDDYGHYDFWDDFITYLQTEYHEKEAYEHFASVVIYYHRIK